MMASPEDSTMAESLRRMASVCFRSVMSFEIATTATGTVCRPLIRLTVAWTGNSRPVLWRTHSSPGPVPAAGHPARDFTVGGAGVPHLSAAHDSQVSDLHSQNLVRTEPVQPLRSTVPVRNAPVAVHADHRLADLVQQ
jgi:hypothetical protein